MSVRITRRRLLQSLGTVSACGLMPPLAACAGQGTINDPLSDAMMEIRNRISAPGFPERDFVITDFGARGDASTVNTAAIEMAIEACHAAGGGRVVVPAGRYCTGQIHLKSNVNLHVSAGAVLLFSQQPRDYLPLVRTWFEGVELMNYSPFIYACEAINVAVTGSGVLDGQADFDVWWSWRGPRSWKGAKSGTSTGWQEGMPYQKASRGVLMQMAADGVPVAERRFGDGHYIRSAMIEFNRCRNVLIEDVTIKNAAFWSVHPVLSVNVTARGVNIINPVGANADGIDPESCDDVLIENCRFDTGDDCISLKSGRDHDGRRIATPCRNVVISGCHFSSERSAVSCGSESSGGIQNVFVENVTAGEVFRLFRIKTNTQRGGVNENIHIRNAQVDSALENFIEIQTNFNEPLKDLPLDQKAAVYIPVIRDISFTNITCGAVDRAFNLPGTAQTPIQNLSMKDITIAAAAKPNIISNLIAPRSENVTIGGKAFSLLP